MPASREIVEQFSWSKTLKGFSCKRLLKLDLREMGVKLLSDFVTIWKIMQFATRIDVCSRSFDEEADMATAVPMTPTTAHTSTSTPSEKLSVTWLKPPDSQDIEDSKVTFASECCKKLCLAMADSREMTA